LPPPSNTPSHWAPLSAVVPLSPSRVVRGRCGTSTPHAPPQGSEGTCWRWSWRLKPTGHVGRVAARGAEQDRGVGNPLGAGPTELCQGLDPRRDAINLESQDDPPRAKGREVDARPWAPRHRHWGFQIDSLPAQGEEAITDSLLGLARPPADPVAPGEGSPRFLEETSGVRYAFHRSLSRTQDCRPESQDSRRQFFIPAPPTAVWAVAGACPREGSPGGSASRHRLTC